MPSIDNRVVRMTFDSSKFDRAIKTTLDLVQAFERALSFKNAESGFQRLQIAIDSLSGKKAASEIDSINGSFDKLDAEKAGKHIESVQDAINKLDSKKAVDSVSAVQESIESTDSKPFNDFISGMQQSADSFNLDGIPKAVSEASSEMQSEFGAMDALLGGALMGLGNTIQSWAVSKLSGIKNMVMQPINDGMQEYQTQMGAIQTILANTGRDFNDSGDIAEVNAALDELNSYADKTIYNFTEMTKNIGTFTAAGISMEDAVPAIQGVANMAAISGSTSEQASHAMYQLSQALSTGTLKLQDWNSVVNAGMGGQVFQDALIRTAYHVHEANGTLGDFQDTLDSVTDGTTSFRESLETGWITSDVLSETLQQMAIEYDKVGDARYKAAEASLLEQGYTQDETDEILRLAKVAEESATKVRTWGQLLDTTKEALGSGWTQTWRIIIGDFKDATNLFTEISTEINNVIGAFDAGRNGVLESWLKWGGRDALFGIYDEIDGVAQLVEDGVLQHIINAIKGWGQPISDAFNEVFGIFSNDFDKDYADVLNEFGANSEEAATHYSDSIQSIYDHVKDTSEEYKNQADEYAKQLKIIAKEQGEDSEAYKTAKEEYLASLDQMVRGSSEFQEAVSRLDTTFKNVVYDDTYAHKVEAVNAANESLKEYEENTLKPTIEKYGEDSDKYKEAVKKMEASEEHKALVENIKNSEKELSDYRNEYLKPIVEEFGEDSEQYREAVFRLENSTEVLDNTFDGTTGVMDWVGQDVSALTQGIKDFTETLIPSEDAMIGIKGAFEGLFSAVDIVVHAFVDLLGIAGGVVSFIRIFTDPVFDFAIELLGAFGQVILSVHDSLVIIRQSLVDAFNAFNSAAFGDSNAIEALGNLYHGFLDMLDIPGKLQSVVDFIRDFIGSITEFIVSNIDKIAAFGERVRVTIDFIKQIFSENKSIQSLGKSFTTLGEKVGKIFEAIGSALTTVKDSLFGTKEEVKQVEEEAQPLQVVVDIFSLLATFVASAADSIKQFVDNLNIEPIISSIAEAGKWLADNLGGAISAISSFIDISGILSTAFDWLSTIGGAVLGIFVTLGSIVVDTVITAFDILSGIVGPVVNTFNSLKDSLFATNEEAEKTEETANPIIEFLKTVAGYVTVLAKILGGVLHGALTLIGDVLQWLVFIIGAVIAGLVIFADIPGKIAAAIEFMGSAFEKIKGFISPAVDVILDFVTKITDAFGVTDKIQGYIDAIREFFGINKQGVEKTANEVDIVTQAMQFFTEIQEKAIGLWGELTRIAGEVRNAIGESEPIKKIVDFFGRIKEDILGLPSKFPIFDESGNVIIFAQALEKVNGVLEYLKTLTPDKLLNDIVSAVDTFIGWIGDAGNRLVSAFSSPKDLVFSIISFAKNFVMNIANFFPHVGGILTKGIQDLVIKASELFSDDSVNNWFAFGEKIIEWFKDIPNKIYEGFTGFIDSLRNGETELPPHLKGIVDTIGDFLNNVAGFDVGGVFNNLVDGIKNIPNMIGDIGKKIKDAFTGVKEETAASNTSGVSSVNPTASGNGTIDALAGVQETEENVDIFGTIFGFISKKVEEIAAFVQSVPASLGDLVSKFARTIGDAINAVLDYINSELLGRLTSVFYEVAKCIAVWNALHLFKGVGDLLSGAGHLMDHMAGIDQKPSVFDNFKNVMISFSIALGSLALSIGLLSLIPAESLDKAVVAVAKIMGFLVGFYLLSAAIEKFLNVSGNLGDSMLKAAASVSVMAIGMVLITKTIDYLSGWVLEKIQDLPKLAAGIAGFIGISVLIGGMLSALAKGGKYALKASAAMIVISGAVLLLSKVIDILGDIVVDKNLDELGKIAASLAALTFAMMGFGYAMSLVGEHGIGAAVGMLGFGAAIIMIADSFAKLEKLDYEKITLISQAFVIMIGEFVGVVFFAEKANMFGVASAFIGFGAAILMIGKSMEGLKDIDYEQLTLIAQTMVVLIGEFGIIAAFVDSNDLVKTGASLIEFSAALGVMSLSLVYLSSVDPDKVNNSATALECLVAVFGLVAKLTQEGDLIASGFGLVEFSASIAIMALSLGQLANIDINQLNGVAIALGGLVAVFGLLGAALALIPGSAVVIVALGAALIELGLAANLLALAFGTAVNILPMFLEQVPALVAGVDILSNHLLEFVESSVALGLMGAALGGFSIALGAFGVAAVIAGAGAEVLANGIKALQSIFTDQKGTSFEEAGENITGGLFAGIISGAKALPQAILEIGKAILEGFLSFFGINSPSTLMQDMVGENIDLGIVEGMTNGMGGIGDTLAGGLGGLLSNIPNILSENAPMIQDWFFNTAIPAVGEWIANAWDWICNFFRENWPKFIDWLVNEAIPAVQDWFFNTAIPAVGEWIGNTWDWICNFFRENWPKFTDWLMNEAIPGIQDWFFNTAIPSLWQWICDTWDNICNFVRENWPKFTDWLMNEALPGIGKWITETLIPGLGEWIKSVFENILNWLGEKKEEIGRWLHDTVLPGLKSWAESIPGKILDGIGNIVEFFKGVGDNIVQGIKEGVLNGYHWVTDAITGLGQSALDAIKNFFGIRSPSTVMRDEVGQQIGKGAELGILDCMDDIKDSSIAMGEAIGSGIGNGIASGMESTASTVAKSGETTVGALEDAMKAAYLEDQKANEEARAAQQRYNEHDRNYINDPEFLKYYDEVYTSGVDDATALQMINDSRWVKDNQRLYEEWQTAQNKTSDTYKAYNEASKKYYTAIGNAGSLDRNTKIRLSDLSVVPEVIDINPVSKVETKTSINNGSTVRFGSVTASETASGIVQNDQRAILKSMNSINNKLSEMKSQNESITDRIRAVERNINVVNNNLSKMKIYMDTGNLVGAIAPKMDEALGLRQIYAERGI